MKEFLTHINVNFNKQLSDFWVNVHYNFTSYCTDVEFGYSPQEKTLLRRANKKRIEKTT
jgi:hypothetical protein